MSPESHLRRIDWGLTHERDRALDAAIASVVAAGSRVLDLGCGSGDLLLVLKGSKQIRERGIEQDGAAVAEGIARGLSIVEGDLEETLGDLGEGSYDLVILNQVIPLVPEPAEIIEGALRVGTRVAVTFPNFAHWRVRLALGLRGELPMTPDLPYRWYDTPHIRLVTVRDFRALCRARGWRVVREAFAALGGRGAPREVRARPNLRAEVALFVLERPHA